MSKWGCTVTAVLVVSAAASVGAFVINEGTVVRAICVLALAISLAALAWYIPTMFRAGGEFVGHVQGQEYDGNEHVLIIAHEWDGSFSTRHYGGESPITIRADNPEDVVDLWAAAQQKYGGPHFGTAVVRDVGQSGTDHMDGGFYTDTAGRLRKEDAPLPIGKPSREARKRLGEIENH